MLKLTGGGLISSNYFVLLKEAANKVGINLFQFEYKKFSDLLSYEQPKKFIVNSSNYRDEYTIPVLTAGKTFILGYTSDQSGVFKASNDKPAIIFDDFTTLSKWVDFDFKVKSSAMKILTCKDKLTLRYCYYCMQNINIVVSDHRRQWISFYSQLRIPLPNLIVQNYIVSILDKFHALVHDISDGLPKEIELRQKQYKFYRDKLLDFEKIE